MKAGIDRIKLKDLDIKQADLEILKLNGYTVIQTNKGNVRMIYDTAIGKELGINYIKVSKKQDNTLIFNELVIGKLEIETAIKDVEYERLDITLPKVMSETSTNEKNINNLDGLQLTLERVSSELEKLGFGEVEIINSNLKEIEVNVNIELEREFEEYKPVLEYLRGLLPNRIKSAVNSSHEPRGRYTGFKVGNDSIGLKFYDKKANILKKDNIDIEKNLLRIEYSFKNEEKIKSVFGSNNLLEIVGDDFITIDRAFKWLLEDDLIDRVYKDIDKQIKHATKYIREYKAVKGISATNNYLKNHQANLFDVEIILIALRNTERTDNYSRVSKNTINSVAEIEGKSLFGNMQKLNEILEVLGYKKIEIDMTKGIKKEVKKHY